ncbi:MAG: hypothetical protein Q4B68_02080 [Bacteroidales bacterium]|nr:hypothetical protein [Bacteroidales bacterium]
MMPQRALAQVASVTIGETTTSYNSIAEALSAAIAAQSATMTMLQDVTLPEGEYMEFNNGDVTLDLAGKTITGDYYCELVNVIGGAKLTIIDSSTALTGKITNTDCAVHNAGGILHILAGTFEGWSGVDINDDRTQISGGRFISTDWQAVVKGGYRSGLALNCAFFNTATGEKLTRFLDGALVMDNGEDATDVTVRTTEVAAVTIGEQTTIYSDANAAFQSALNAGQPATVKLLFDLNLPCEIDSCFTIDKGDITVDLAGYTIRSGYSCAFDIDGGKLTIIDSSEKKTGKITDGTCIHAERGELTILDATITGQFALYLRNEATTIIKGGRFAGKSYGISTNDNFTLPEGYVAVETTTGEEIAVGNLWRYKDVTIMKPETPVASVTTTEGTTQYYTIQKAVGTAINAEAATITLLEDITLPELWTHDKYVKPLSLKFDRGNVTLDLAGKTITGQRTTDDTYDEKMIAVYDGAQLTVVDSSTPQCAKMKTESPNSTVLYAENGSISVHGGTFEGSVPLRFINYNCNGTLYGGRYKSTTDGLAIWANENLQLAEGYGVFDSLTGDALIYDNGFVTTADGQFPTDATVKLIETPTGMGQIHTPAAKAEKRIDDGQLIIVKDGKKYTTTGILLGADSGMK